MLRRATYTPDARLVELVDRDVKLVSPFAGLHVFTFNQLESTVYWLDRMQATAGAVVDQQMPSDRSAITRRVSDGGN